MKIWLGDCLDHLEFIPTPDFVLTSPPYDSLRSYGNGEGFGDHIWKPLLLGLFSKLSKGSVVAWNVGDETVGGSESGTSFKQALFAKEVGFNLHDTMIWQKSNFSNPSNVRYHQLFEYVFIFSKGKPRVFNPIKDKPNKYTQCWGKNTSRQKNGEMRERQKNGEMRERQKNVIGNFGMRGNVWKGNTAGQENVCKSLPHPAMMPQWLARDLVISWSNPGDLVYDPFTGSGTTGVAAIRTGRRFIGSEKNPEYQRSAAWALFEA